MKFIYGEEDYLINLEIKKITTSFNGLITTYDEVDDIDTIIMDMSTISMFGDKKMIIIKNHSLLSKAPVAEMFLKEMTNSLDENIELIFVLEKNTFLKNKLTTYLKSNADVLKFDKIDSKTIVKTIKDIVTQRGGSISNSAAIKLAAKVPENLRIIIQEIKKLLTESNEITDKMVDVSIGDYINEDYFALTNAIVANDKSEIIRSYQEKVKNGEQNTLIIGQIASVLNLAALVGNMRSRGLSNQDISSELKIHAFRIKKANELILATSLKRIEELIQELAILDADIKTGKIDESHGMNSFILDLIK